MPLQYIGPTPSSAADLTTKSYVDGAAGGGGSVAAFTIPGALAVAVGSVRWYAPKSITITSVVVSVGTASLGASVIFDVNKNGTTIFTTQANRPTVAASAFTASTTGMSVTTLTTSDYITVDIDQIGTTYSGADAVVQIIYS
jgi:NO-binding membrane sensor protein with MHYT domain